MLAIISYSLTEDELYIIPLINELLKGRFNVESVNTKTYRLQGLGSNEFFRMKACSLFIGIISMHGEDSKLIYEQFEAAQKLNIPSLLFEEVKESDVSITQDNQVKFNRGNQGEILAMVDKKIAEVISGLSQEASFIDKDELAWIVSGSTASNIIKWFNAKQSSGLH